MNDPQSPAVPFRVTFEMATPIAINHPWLHFDSIVSHLISMRVLGRRFYSLPTKTVQHLSTTEMGDWRYALRKTAGMAHASISFFEPDEMTSQQYYCRFEPAGVPGLSRVLISAGHYRNWMMQWVLVPCHICTFYGCGNVDLVSDLISGLSHLGNDTRVGWGRIHATRIERIEQDVSLVRNGVAQRPIPTWQCAVHEDVVSLGWRAPYWSSGAVDLCVPPGARVSLLSTCQRKSLWRCTQGLRWGNFEKLAENHAT